MNFALHEQEELRSFYRGDSGPGGARVPAVPHLAALRLVKTPALPPALAPHLSRSGFHLPRLLSAGDSVEDLPSPRTPERFDPRTGCSHSDWLHRSGAAGTAGRIDSALLDCAPRES